MGFADEEATGAQSLSGNLSSGRRTFDTNNYAILDFIQKMN